MSANAFFMSDTMRTFIAFELPGNIITAIREVQESIKSYGFRVRWVRPENIHLTLKFLGNINEAEIEKIGRAILDTVKEYSPILLSAKGIGVFPGVKQPRVIWVGITGQMDSLLKMQKVLDDRLEAIGFSRENRPFKGHLTLGRVKGKIDSKRLVKAMEDFQGFESEPFTADQIILFKSELKPTGSVYTKLLSASLLY